MVLIAVVLPVFCLMAAFAAVPAEVRGVIMGLNSSMASVGWLTAEWKLRSGGPGGQGGAALEQVGGGLPLGYAPADGYGPFNEVWAVYDGLDVAFDADCEVATFEGDPVLWGVNAGLVDTETMGYAATGLVIEAAGPFDGHGGSAMAMEGAIVVADDDTRTAPGTLLIG